MNDTLQVSEADENAAGCEAVAREFLEELVQRMGFEVTVQSAEEDEKIVLAIEGEESPDLIGRKGQTLDALQFLTNRTLNKQTRQRKQVVVDCGGYRQRRVEALTELAGQLGEEATRTGKTVAVNPMSAHDRRIIHMALRENPGVTTRSEGEGLERHLLVVPVQE
jgi:spoIIIJ-associated protein